MTHKLLLSTALAALLLAGTSLAPAVAQPSAPGGPSQDRPSTTPPGPSPGSAVPAPPNPDLAGPPPNDTGRSMPRRMEHGPTAQEMNERMQAMHSGMRERMQAAHPDMAEMMRGMTIRAPEGEGTVIVIPPIIIMGGHPDHGPMMRHGEPDRSSSTELSGSGAGQGMDNPVAAYMAANDRMHRDMSIEFTGNADKDFALLMIAHHQGAIDMAKIVLEHGDDAEIKQLAQQIIQTQEAEVATLRDWLAKNPGR